MDYNKIIKRVGNVRLSTSDINGAVDIDVTCRFNSGPGWAKDAPPPTTASADFVFVKNLTGRWVIRRIPSLWMDTAARAFMGRPLALERLLDEITCRGAELAEEFEISEFAVAEVRAYREEKKREG